MVSVAYLARTLATVGPPPCETNGTCPFRADCAERLLACFAFVRYASNGTRVVRQDGDIPNEHLFSLTTRESEVLKASQRRIKDERAELEYLASMANGARL